MNTKTVIILFILSVPAFAKGQMVINVDTCRNRAVQYSEEMLIAKKQYEKALYTKKEHRSNYLPKISASGIYMYNDFDGKISWEDTYLPTANFNPATGELDPNIFIDPSSGNPVIDNDGNPVFNSYAYIPAAGLKYNLTNTWYASIAAEQPIYMGGKILSANKMADIGVNIYELNIDEQRQNIILEADKTYWMYVSVAEQIKVAETYISLLDSLISMVGNAIDAGLTHKNELLKVQVKRNEAKLQYDKTINGKELLRMSLCRIMGLGLFTGLAIADSVIEIDDSILFIDNQTIIQNRTDYKILQKQIELKKANETLTRSDFLPQLGVQFSYGYFKALERSTTPGAFDFGNGYLLDDGSPSIMASVTIPIFQWGEGRNKLKQAKIETEIAHAESEKYNELMVLEIHQAKLNLKLAYNRYAAAITNLEQSEENMELSRNSYEVGMELLTDYLEAQAQWQEAYAEYINSKTDYKIAKSIYLKAIGEF